MTYRGAGLFILVSIVSLPIALFLLAKAHRSIAFTLLVAYFLAFPLIMAAIYQVSDQHLRLWLAMVAVTGFVPWIALGPIAYGIATRRPDQWLGEGAKPRSARVQLRGLIVFIIGAIAWAIGAFGSDLSKGFELLLVAIALYGLWLGAFWLMGREFR
jgi:hypothetical protein